MTNPDESSLRVIDLAAGVVRGFALPAPPPLTLHTPVGVAAGPAGLLYVLDSDAGRVVVLSAGP